MCKVLIADGCEEFGIELSGALQNAHHVHTCTDGMEAIECVRGFEPDVIILDLMLPKVDGLGLVKEIRRSGADPILIATVRFTSDYVLTAAQKLRIDYMMLKPCDGHLIGERMADLLQTRRKCVCSQREENNPSTSELLLKLNIPTNFSGFSYLNDAIELMLKSPKIAVTKELYPALAHVHGTTAAQVERGIRSAIHAGWKNCDREQWREFFSAEPDGMIKRPSNGFFISRLSYALRELHKN